MRINIPLITTLGDKKKSESDYIRPVEASTQSKGNARVKLEQSVTVTVN